MATVKEMYDAVNQGDIALVRRLLAEEPSLVNASTPFGPMLHVAAASGNVECVDTLLSAGADITALGGTFGGNALNYAASSGQVEVVRYLLEHGAEMDVSDPERNPLFGAIFSGNIELVKLLLEYGIRADVKYTGESMKNMGAREFAIERGQSAIADLLSNV